MLEHLRRRSTPPPTCWTSLRKCAARWRVQAADARAPCGWRASAFCCCCWPPMAWSGPDSAPASILAGARSALARGAACVACVVPRAAAAPPGDRRAGGAVSRGARAVAAGHAPQRGGSEPCRAIRSRRRWCVGSWSRRSRSARRSTPRGVLSGSRCGAMRRRWRLWRCRRAGGAVGAGFLIHHAVGPLRLFVDRSRCAGRAPYRIEVTAGQRSVPKGTDQIVSAKLVGFDAEDAVVHGAARADGEMGGRGQLIPNSKGIYEGIAVRRHCAARYLRRGGRRPVEELHGQGGESAVRAADGDGVPVPGVHRARAAEDRGRRRHRGACAAPKCACSVFPR